jgi:hypothetical protein
MTLSRAVSPILSFGVMRPSDVAGTKRVRQTIIVRLILSEVLELSESISQAPAVRSLRPGVP